MRLNLGMGGASSWASVGVGGNRYLLKGAAPTPTPAPTPAPTPTPTPTPTPSPVVFTPTHIWDFEPVPEADGPFAADKMDPEFNFERFLTPFQMAEISNESAAHGAYSGKCVDAYGFYPVGGPLPTLTFEGDFSVEMFVKTDGPAGKRLSSLLSSGLLRFGIAGDLAGTPGGWMNPTNEPQFANRLCADLNTGGAPVFFGLSDTVPPGQFAYVAFFRKDGMLNVKLNSAVGTPLAFSGAMDFSSNGAPFFGADSSGEMDMALTGFIDSIRVCSTSSALAHVNSPAPTGPFTP